MKAWICGLLSVLSLFASCSQVEEKDVEEKEIKEFDFGPGPGDGQYTEKEIKSKVEKETYRSK
jgi:hypothetical protein